MRILFLFLLLFPLSVASQTVIDLETGKVRGKTVADYQQENSAMRYRAAKDSAAYNALVVRALNALHTDSLPQAESLLTEAIRLRPAAPDNGTLHYLLGEIALAQARYGIAVERYARALALQPDHHRARHNKALAEMQIGNYNAALENCDVLLRAKQNEFSRDELLFLRGSCAYRAKLYDRARADFETLLAERPSAESAILLLASTDFASGRTTQAMDRLNLFLQQHPAHIDALTLRADFERQQGQLDAAVYDLTQAISAAPTDAELYLLRAQLFRALGKEKQADDDRRKARELSAAP